MRRLGMQAGPARPFAAHEAAALPCCLLHATSRQALPCHATPSPTMPRRTPPALTSSESAMRCAPPDTCRHSAPADTDTAPPPTVRRSSTADACAGVVLKRSSVGTASWHSRPASVPAHSASSALSNARQVAPSGRRGCSGAAATSNSAPYMAGGGGSGALGVLWERVCGKPPRGGGLRQLSNIMAIEPLGIEAARDRRTLASDGCANCNSIPLNAERLRKKQRQETGLAK